MADGSGGIGILGVIVGAVLVLGIGFFALHSGTKGGGSTTGVSISSPVKK